MPEPVQTAEANNAPLTGKTKIIPYDRDACIERERAVQALARAQREHNAALVALALEQRAQMAQGVEALDAVTARTSMLPINQAWIDKLLHEAKVQLKASTHGSELDFSDAEWLT